MKRYWRLSLKDECHYIDPAWKQIVAHILWIFFEELDDWLVHKTRLDNYFGCIIFRGPWKKLAEWACDHDPWEYLEVIE
jgi:hypothetical protein